MSAPAAVEFRGISKRFGEAIVLRDVSFVVPAGRTVGLVGENGAGKSTLMNLLGGNLAPDGGELFLAGERYAPASPSAAAVHGVAFIHQELNLFANLTIEENLFLTRFPRRRMLPLIARGELRQAATDALRAVGLELSPDAPVETLSAGQRQMVEIARALSQNARVLILDEPTSSLGHRECAAFFSLMEKLQTRGLTMIFISHFLEDVRRVCDEIVVLRDGAVVGQGESTAFTHEELVARMVGRSLTQLFPERASKPGTEPLLEVKHVSEPRVARDVNLTVHRGEVLGLAGLMGAGRSELARIIFGLDPHRSGEVHLDGKRIDTLSTRERIAAGLAFLTEERRAEGLCLDASIQENLNLATLSRHARGAAGWLDTCGLLASATAVADAVRLIARAGLTPAVRTLSGGNQQKVVLGKWLLAQPKLLVLDEPTRGVDVGARFELYRSIFQHADAGAGVLMISSDLEELIGLCDRIVVMSQGEVRGEFTRGSFERERMMAAALPAAEATA